MPKRGIETVVTYYDPGISGLHIKGRDALQQLIEDVQLKNRLFDVVLVYDISRWGRFQDIDESAYYEYICRRAGVPVYYCAEPFENDGSALWPQSPRASSVSPRPNIAASYRLRSSMRSADWSNSVIDKAGYGLRRLLLSDKGVPKGELRPGEIKNIFTDRIVLVPGPRDEVAIVRWIFDSFVRRGKGEGEIAKLLNKRNIKNVSGRLWTGEKARSTATKAAPRGC